MTKSPRRHTREEVLKAARAITGKDFPPGPDGTHIPESYRGAGTPGISSSEIGERFGGVGRSRKK